MQSPIAIRMLQKAGINPTTFVKGWNTQSPEIRAAREIEDVTRMLSDGPVITNLIFPREERIRVANSGGISIDEEGNVHLSGNIKGIEFYDWQAGREMKLDLRNASDYTKIKEAETFMNHADPRRRADVLRRMVDDGLINILPPYELKQLLNSSDLAYTRQVEQIVRKYATRGGVDLRAAKVWVNYCRNPLSVE
jgi:hypothetical protein